MTLALLDAAGSPLLISREPQGVARSENDLGDLLFAHPVMLPIQDIDPGFGRIVPVAKELVIPDVGRVDALLVDEYGKLIVVEAKLWRNPQARREVVAQILDYARELARFTYEDLQRQISIATKRSGMTLWRSKGEGMVGAFITWRGGDGLALYEQLSEDREAIDREFAEAGLAPPEWTSSGSEASITLRWSSRWPWDEAEEARQRTLLSQATNQFVNSLRPRLGRISHG